MNKNIKLFPPCSYQGGKQRLAEKIVDIIEEENHIDENTKFYDLCCGSGAITLEVINRGLIHPSNIIMVDSGCFGEFWNSIANNEFDLDMFKKEIDKLPEKGKIKDYLFNLSKQPVDFDSSVYHYLLLQAGSFGSKAIWKDNPSKWCTSSFRSYWLPTETSSRRSPVNPMMPMPETIYDRVKQVVNELGGIVNAIHGDLFDVLNEMDEGNSNAIIYCDPPYKNTSGYGDDFNAHEVVMETYANVPIYISEGENMEDSREGWLLSKGRSKGNLTGNIKKKPVEEWLNVFYTNELLRK